MSLARWMFPTEGDQDVVERPFAYPLPRGETMLMITRQLGLDDLGGLAQRAPLC